MTRAPDDVAELREQVRGLTERVYELEQRLGLAAPPPRTPRPAGAPPTPRAPPAAPPPAIRARPDLETTLGVRWLTALGTLVLVLGGAFFVVYFLGEAFQILAGVLGGLAIVAGGEWLHRRARYGPYPYFLVAGGVVLVYFSVFAAYAFDEYRVATGMTLLADSVLLALVAAGGVGLAFRYDSKALAAEGFALGLLTTLLMLEVDPAQTGLQTLTLVYLALLAGGLLAVVAVKRWVEVGVAGAAGTWIVLAVLRPELHLHPAVFAAVVIVVALELWILAERAAARAPAWGAAAALLASAGGTALLWGHVDTAFAGAGQHVLWVLAAAHLAAAFALPAPALRAVAGAAAAALAYLWAPDAFDGWPVTIAWSILTVALAAAAARFALATRWLRAVAYAGCAALAARAIVYDSFEIVPDSAAAWTTTAAALSATAAFVAAYLFLGSASARLPADERALAARGLLAAAVVSPLPWLFFRLENWASVGWAAEGAALVAVGFASARRDVRLAGIGVLLLVVARVLLVDSSVLDTGWRVVVFLAVGALVLGAAFLFARRSPPEAPRA